MKNIVAIMLVLVTAQALPAQLRHKTYRVRLELLNGHSLTGYLQHVTDSSIQMTKKIQRSADTTVHVSQIKTIGLRRQRALRTGIAAGSSIGFIMGLLIGGDPSTTVDCVATSFLLCPDGGSGLGGAFAGYFLGGALGAVVGSTYKKFEINGDATAYKMFRDKQKG